MRSSMENPNNVFQSFYLKVQSMNFYSKHIFPYIEAAATSGLKSKRKRALAAAFGNVLEIGTGAGQNFPFINSNISSYTAIDPSPTFISMATRKKRSLPRYNTLDIIQGQAEFLPFKPLCFDIVICFLVLCTVHDLDRSISEIKRVLKPNGNLIIFEHVLSKDKIVSKWQSFLNPIWKHVGCGCNLTRDTIKSIDNEGFKTMNLSRYQSPSMGLPITSQVIEGIATK